MAEVFGLWENHHRNALKKSLGPNTIRPELEAFGDLRHIRNDLLHNGKASKDECGKCTILKWFAPGEPIVLGVRHVLDFLNQIGVLSLGAGAYDDASRACRFEAYDDTNTLLNWNPGPKIISVRTLSVGRDLEPVSKCVAVVFDNGYFANVPFSVSSKDEWDSSGEAGIDNNGDLCFADGNVISASFLYRHVIRGLGQRKKGEERAGIPIVGPAMRIRRSAETENHE